MRTVPADEVNVLREESVGKYRVQLFLSRYNEPVYRVLVEVRSNDWREIQCISDTDERRFPMKAARCGNVMVTEYRANRVTNALPQYAQLKLFPAES
jgi:hypothetical protein